MTDSLCIAYLYIPLGHLVHGVIGFRSHVRSRGTHEIRCRVNQRMCFYTLRFSLGESGECELPWPRREPVEGYPSPKLLNIHAHDNITSIASRFIPTKRRLNTSTR